MIDHSASIAFPRDAVAMKSVLLLPINLRRAKCSKVKEVNPAPEKAFLISSLESPCLCAMIWSKALLVSFASSSFTPSVTSKTPPGLRKKESIFVILFMSSK